MIDRRIAWLSLWITTLGVIIAVVFYFLQQKSPSIKIKITSQSNVLDLHTSVADLKVIFQGEDIQQENLNLKLYTIQVSNDGSEPIKQGDYDRENEWGLHINSARIIEARISNASSDYLRQNFRAQRLGTDTVSFSKPILDPSQSVILTVLVIHRKEVEPTFSALGKIAGVDHLQIERSAAIDNPKSSFWTRPFEGDLSTILVRFLVGIVLFILLISAIIAITVGVSKLKLKHRKSTLNKIFSIESLPDTVFQPMFPDKGMTVALASLVQEFNKDNILRNAQLLVSFIYTQSGKRGVKNLLPDLEAFIKTNETAIKKGWVFKQNKIEQIVSSHLGYSAIVVNNAAISSLRKSGLVDFESDNSKITISDVLRENVDLFLNS